MTVIARPCFSRPWKIPFSLAHHNPQTTEPRWRLEKPINQITLIFNPHQRLISALEFQVNGLKMGRDNRAAAPTAPPTKCCKTRKKTSP
jgi:hypothetical protein